MVVKFHFMCTLSDSLLLGEPVKKKRKLTVFCYLTVTSFYLREREHAKYPSVLHSRLSYYTLVIWFKDTEPNINKIEFQSNNKSITLWIKQICADILLIACILFFPLWGSKKYYSTRKISVHIIYYSIK